MTDWRKHPEYTEGFENEMDGEPHRATSSEPYIAGWKAAERVKAIFREHGMKQDADGGFSITLPPVRAS